MQIKGSLEENVLTLLCTSDQHAPGLIMELTPALFSTRYLRKIAEVAFKHIAEYGRAPGPHLGDLMEEDLRRGEEGVLLTNLLVSIQELAGAIQPEYVLSQLGRFTELRKLAMAVEEAADAVQAGDIEGARKALYTRDMGIKQTPGTWLTDADRMLAFLNRREDDQFTSGIAELDKRGVRPARKELFMWLGSKAVGKSWALIQCGKNNMMARRSVLHITLEMSEEITAGRYVQALFAMSKEHKQVLRLPIFKKDQLGRFSSIDFDELHPEHLESGKRAVLAKRLGTFRSKPKLLIKEFPTSSLTIAMLRAYLDMLDRVEGFRPDLLIIDYLKIMALDPKNLRISAGHLAEQIRGLAAERNMAVVTAWQGNRSSSNAKVVTSEMISEDWSLAATVDNLVTISRTAAERKIGLARLLVDKARNALDKYLVMISQSYQTGQFCIDSVYMNQYVEDEVGRLSGDIEEDG